MKTINAGNYFHAKGFDKICNALEQGEVVNVHIDCIGHTLNNCEQENYKDELVKKYADKLTITKEEMGFSYSYTYKLK